MADAKLTVISGERIPLRVTEGRSVALSLDGPVYNAGTKDYEALSNKPSIEGVELVGNRELDEIGLGEISGTDILALFDR